VVFNLHIYPMGNKILMRIFYLSHNAHPKSFGGLMRKLQDEGEYDELSKHVVKICHIAHNNGTPLPPYAKPLRDVDAELNEIRSQYKNNELLRIYYFVDKQNEKMILLNITIKPSLYEKHMAKKVNREIQEDINEAITLKEKYSISHSDYVQL
jgi:hypothetical protein